MDAIIKRLMENHRLIEGSSRTTAYVATDRFPLVFDESRSTEIGLHVGSSITQALDRQYIPDHDVLIELILDLSGDSITLKDLDINWSNYIVLSREFPDIANDLIAARGDRYRISKIVRDYLLERGITYIVYHNDIEGEIDSENLSYILLTPDIIIDQEEVK